MAYKHPSNSHPRFSSGTDQAIVPMLPPALGEKTYEHLSPEAAERLRELQRIANDFAEEVRTGKIVGPKYNL